VLLPEIVRGEDNISKVAHGVGSIRRFFTQRYDMGSVGWGLVLGLGVLAVRFHEGSISSTLLLHEMFGLGDYGLGMGCGKCELRR